MSVVSARPSTVLREVPVTVLLRLGLAGALIVGGLVLGLFVASASASSVLMAIAGAAVLAACAFFFVSDRYAVTLALTVLYIGLADGFLKLRFDSDVAGLGRDALVYSIVAGWLVRVLIGRERWVWPPLSGYVVAFVAAVAIQIANPFTGPPQDSIQALRQHVEFLPLFFLAYRVLRTPQALRGALVILVLVASVNGVVNAIQFNLTPAQFSAWGPGYEARINGTGDVSARAFRSSAGEERTRPFGLGSDIGFGGIVAVTALPGLLALLAIARRRRALLLPILLAALPIAVGIVTSQARLAIVGSFLAAFGYVVLGATSRRLASTLVPLLVAGTLIYVGVSAFTGDQTSGAFSRYETISPGQVFTTTYDYRIDTIRTIPKYLADYPLGAGLGTVGPANGLSLRANSGIAFNAESQFTFLIVELGIPGLLLYLALFVAVFRAGFRAVRRTADPETRILLVGLVAPMFFWAGAMFLGIVSAAPPGSLYLWLVAGAVAYWSRAPEALARDRADGPGAAASGA